MIELKIKGTNGNKFSVSKGDASYIIKCCKRNAALGWSKGPNSKRIGWKCNDCGNQLSNETLQI